MSHYLVTLPVTGYCIVDVDAESENAAIDAAMKIASAEHLESWQTHREITTGNVCHAEIDSASAELDE